jgi:hypothetical protein
MFIMFGKWKMSEVDLLLGGLVGLVIIGAILGIVFGTAWSFMAFMGRHAGKFVIMALFILVLQYFGMIGV